MVLKAEKKKRINSRDSEFDTIYALSSEKENLNINLPYDEEIENLCDYNLSTLKKIHSIVKTTIIQVTHSFEEAFFLGDRIALMNKGRIVQVGRPNEVFRKPNSKFAADFLRVGNLFKGKSTVTGGIAEINISGISMVSATLKSGDRYISIRPEDVLVSKERITSSARNSFKGRIESILDRGTTVRIVVDIGIPFVTILTKRSFEDLGLRKGMPVYITFKASAIHIF